MIAKLPFWVEPFGVGFALSFSLILAIGAQNAFVLKQGLMRQHILPLVLFCAVSDAILIGLGVGGLAPFLSIWMASVEKWLFAGAALWLGVYGLLRARDAYRGANSLEVSKDQNNGLVSTLAIAATLTFGNPHVYLDTVLLISAVSIQFEDSDKFGFAAGAIIASFVFFFGLGYGAAAFSTVMKRPHAWRVLDTMIALVMLTLGFGMARAGGWI